MKGLRPLIALLALAVPTAAIGQDLGATPGNAPVQYDGTDAFVSVGCSNDELPCAGAVVLLLDGAQIGTAPFSVAAETTDRVRVPATPQLENVSQVVVVIGTVSAARQVERIRTETGIGPGQTEVEPQARERSCRAFSGASQIRVRGLECVEAARVVRAAAKKKNKSFKVSGFSCRRLTKTNVSCTDDKRLVKWRRSAR
jgi:hypothetical protein